MRRQTIWNLLWDWSRIIDRARYAKKDGEKRQKVIRFGFFAVLYAAIALACSFALLLFTFIGKVWLITSIFCIAIAIAIGIIGTGISLITTLIYWFCQLSLNKRPWTWISLALLLLLLAGIAYPIVLLTV